MIHRIITLRWTVLVACVIGVAAIASAKPVRPGMAPPPMKAASTRLVMETNHGRVILELFPEKAPLTVANFLGYVDERFYDGMIFHRVIRDFMIQGGGFEPGLKEKKTRPPIKNEAANGLANERGAIATARTANPHSATAQFFINTKDNPFLDRVRAHDKEGYCVFGKVVEGMEVIDRIRMVATHAQGGHMDVPVQDVVIVSIRRVTN
jgi:peptidyl-prolyl cis-trans isomerase B (cyclophilin B)